MLVTRERLRELLDYDPLTGLFAWKVKRNSSRGCLLPGTIAGTVGPSNGYVYIKVDGKRYFAHRLAFLWMEGTMPPEQVDHINGVRSDNRWSNLRHATQWENIGNRAVFATSKSGVKGVYWNKKAGKWRATIRSAGRQHFLGYFNTVEEAQAVYNFAAGLVFGQFAVHNSRKEAPCN